MKKELILSILILLLLPSIISAVEIALTKDSYQPGETLQAEFKGNFISLKSENIIVYKNNRARYIPVVSDFTKQKETSYYYAILPYEEGNYSLRVENSLYTEAGQEKSGILIKNFTIKKTNQTALSVNLGFVIASKDFSIKVKSVNGNPTVVSRLELTGETKNFSLVEDVEKTLKFSIPATNSTQTSLKINYYNIPVFIIQSSNNNITPTDLPQLEFSPPSLTGKVKPGNTYFFKVILKNSANQSLSNINLENNLNLTIEPKSIKDLDGLSYSVINITIPVSSDLKGELSGKITAEIENKILTLPVNFEITKNESDINLTGTTIAENLSCSSMGKICDFSKEECIGKTTKSLEGPCCIGECIAPKESNPKLLIGIIILIIVFALVAWVFLKSRKKSLKSPEDMLREKSRKFQERMNLPETEVRNRLGKV